MKNNNLFCRLKKLKNVKISLANEETGAIDLYLIFQNPAV